MDYEGCYPRIPPLKHTSFCTNALVVSCTHSTPHLSKIVALFISAQWGIHVARSRLSIYDMDDDVQVVSFKSLEIEYTRTWINGIRLGLRHRPETFPDTLWSHDEAQYTIARRTLHTLLLGLINTVATHVLHVTVWVVMRAILGELYY